ncbi:hypothetical protein [Taibaiella soli]|uniref:Uncharacterized protein n=1 Tax=Taibaiella soli TaxID=1649169 RepID=A0A2W2AEP0_9BACT|nr:hypothetical protein [Taibaiella soli]PZF73751.1 hypothetical protein DN068_07070 [Taibaiella soli]
MKYTYKMPLGLKILALIIVIAAAIWTGIISLLRDGKNRNDFYIKSFTSLVLTASSTDGGRFTTHELTNGLKIDFFQSARNQLEVGDSVQKDDNTFKYNVYRRDIVGEYQFLGVFDYTKFTNRKMKAIFKGNKLLVVLLLASCNVNATYEDREEDKMEVEAVADSFYNRLEQGDHTGSYSFYTKKFLEVTDTSKIRALYKNIEGMCGIITSYKLLDWKTLIVKGTNSKSEYYLQYEAIRSHCKTLETLTFKKEDGRIRITTCDIKMP